MYDFKHPYRRVLSTCSASVTGVCKYPGCPLREWEYPQKGKRSKAECTRLRNISYAVWLYLDTYSAQELALRRLTRSRRTP